MSRSLVAVVSVPPAPRGQPVGPSGLTAIAFACGCERSDGEPEVLALDEKHRSRRPDEYCPSSASVYGSAFQLAASGRC